MSLDFKSAIGAEYNRHLAQPEHKKLILWLVREGNSYVDHMLMVNINI